MFNVVCKITSIAQNYVSKVLRSNDVAVDATLGKGADSLFLSSRLPNGKVYSFEIQSEAVEKFNGMLKEKDIKNIFVTNDGHENMDKYVTERPRAVMFNLGYLPGGNVFITTKAETSRSAVEKGLDMLLPGGIMTIAVYIGHEGGKDEADTILEFVGNLNSKKYSAMAVNYLNRSSSPPFLIVIEKNDNCSEGK